MSRLSILMVASLVVIAGAIDMSHRATSADAPTSRTVTVKEIFDRRVVLIGNSGKPIGTMLTLRGTWRQNERGKGSRLLLRITNIDGVELMSPFDFESHFIHAVDGKNQRIDPEEGDQWEMAGYEHCRNEGIPQGYLERIGELPFQDPWAGFQSHLSVVVSKLRQK